MMSDNTMEPAATVKLTPRIEVVRVPGIRCNRCGNEIVERQRRGMRKNPPRRMCSKCHATSPDNFVAVMLKAYHCNRCNKTWRPTARRHFVRCRNCHARIEA